MPESRLFKLVVSALVVSFCVLFVGILCIKVSDYDLWWHLALGRDLLEKSCLSLPDTFSFSFFGIEQYNGEWLADLVMYLSYYFFGLPGIYLFKIFIMSLVFYGLYRISASHFTKKQKSEIAIAILGLVVVLFALRFRLFIRPYLFSYLGFVFFLYVLNRAQQGQYGHLFWSLIPAGLLWANTSKGVFLGVLLLSLYAIDRLANKKICRADVAVFTLVPLASLINPEVWKVYELLFGFAGGDRALALVGEQQPLSLQMLWGGGWSYTFCYQILVVTGAIYLVFLKGWRNLFHLLSFFVFLAFSVALIRMIDFFALLAGLFFFLTCSAIVARTPGLRVIGAEVWAGVVGTLALVLFLVFVPNNPTYAFGVGVKEFIFPEKALTFLRENNIQGRLFNSYPFGGYLAFFHPAEKVFIDGRGYHLYPTEFMVNYLRSVGEQSVWKELDKEWQFEVALLEYDHRSFGRHFARHITANPDWALVFWDEKATVYLKKTQKFTDVINRHQHKIVRPNFYDFSYLMPLLKKSGLALIEDLESELRKNPDNQEVRLAKAFSLYTMNRKLFLEEIKKELLLCNQLYPEVAMEYSGLALLYYEEKNRSDARRMAQKALSIDPGDVGGKFVMEKLGE